MGMVDPISEEFLVTCCAEAFPQKGGLVFRFRSFDKGLADRGGWREEIRPMPEIEASFLHPFSYAPLRSRGTHLWTIFRLFLGVC